ncbi:MAG: DUF4864 domain-containing protein [Alphaproteobacteria bacterium]|nr:DUF4864 domain-containing protein [Alphaproteobacteria bacterium]
MACLKALCLAILLLVAAPVPAQQRLDLPAPDREAIRTIIESQMAAFRRDDGAAAFAFATPGIQAMFGSPENFIEMVRRGYAAVYRPRAVEFADIMGDAERPVQLVHLVGPDGEAVIAAYEMVRDGAGWRINGCVLLRPPGRTT